MSINVTEPKDLEQIQYFLGSVTFILIQGLQQIALDKDQQ